MVYDMVIYMKCLNQKCDAEEIEKDDNFCYKCGQWTAKGYSFLNDRENVEKIISGPTVKQGGNLFILGSLLVISCFIFTVMIVIRGEDLFKPFYYLKKQAFNYIYGYNTSLMKTDNKYSKKNINNYGEAIEIIKKDFSQQDIYCFNDIDVRSIASKIEDNYLIPSVSFCDMSIEETNKVKSVIDKMYLLFPNIKGALTNITITNASTKSEYIARFQPMYQFVNINENINSYNKVNKTQILINSYYFLNEDIMNNSVESVVGKNWYVEDANWESTIAHEYGHYISFVSLLRKYGIENITLVTKDNKDIIDTILDEFNSGRYSTSLLEESLNKYNNKYKSNISLKDYACSISKYACVEDKNNNLIADETIAEAIHDYYLHGNNMKSESKEIIEVIKSKL